MKTKKEPSKFKSKLKDVLKSQVKKVKRNENKKFKMKLEKILRDRSSIKGKKAAP